MTTNQIYNLLIKVLKARGYKCYRCEPEVGGSKSDKIINKDKQEYIEHLWQTCKYYQDVVGLHNGLIIVERIYKTIENYFEGKDPSMSLEKFYDENIDKV